MCVCVCVSKKLTVYYYLFICTLPIYEMTSKQFARDFVKKKENNFFTRSLKYLTMSIYDLNV